MLAENVWPQIEIIKLVFWIVIRLLSILLIKKKVFSFFFVNLRETIAEKERVKLIVKCFVKLTVSNWILPNMDVKHRQKSHWGKHRWRACVRPAINQDVYRPVDDIAPMTARAIMPAKGAGVQHICHFIVSCRPPIRMALKTFVNRSLAMRP